MSTWKIHRYLKGNPPKISTCKGGSYKQVKNLELLQWPPLSSSSPTQNLCVCTHIPGLLISSSRGRGLYSLSLLPTRPCLRNWDHTKRKNVGIACFHRHKTNQLSVLPLVLKSGLGHPLHHGLCPHLLHVFHFMRWIFSTLIPALVWLFSHLWMGSLGRSLTPAEIPWILWVPWSPHLMIVRPALNPITQPSSRLPPSSPPGA